MEQHVIANARARGLVSCFRSKGADRSLIRYGWLGSRIAGRALYVANERARD
jgi:hypothetical protein